MLIHIFLAHRCSALGSSARLVWSQLDLTSGYRLGYIFYLSLIHSQQLLFRHILLVADGSRRGQAKPSTMLKAFGCILSDHISLTKSNHVTNPSHQQHGQRWTQHPSCLFLCILTFLPCQFSFYATQTGFKIAGILVPQPMECWNCRCAPPWAALSILVVVLQSDTAKRIGVWFFREGGYKTLGTITQFYKSRVNQTISLICGRVL